ncbi:MAG: tol-pal system protein YbgF [Myxococcales bacterium]|nr:tol-pal system protein YbgF [Myxococcales bacterium]
MVRNARALFCALVAFVAMSCAAPSKSLRKENTVLAREVETLRADRRSSERKLRELRAEMLHERERRPLAPAPKAAGTSYVATPLADDSVTISNVAPDERVIDVLDDGTEIVYAGDAAKGTSVTLSGDALAQAPRGTAKVAVAPISATPSKPAPLPKVAAVVAAATPATPVAPLAVMPTTEVPVVIAASAPAPRKRAAPIVANWPSDPALWYQAALGELKQGRHDAAVEGLAALITKHPSHEFADNAQYWIGEAFYDRRQFEPALVAFQTTIARYPKGNKSADATLKAGLCMASLGDAARAAEYLRRVISLYPTSDSAAIARERLHKLMSTTPATVASSKATPPAASPPATSVRIP